MTIAGLEANLFGHEAAIGHVLGYGDLGEAPLANGLVLDGANVVVVKVLEDDFRLPFATTTSTRALPTSSADLNVFLDNSFLKVDGAFASVGRFATRHLSNKKA